MVNSEGNRKLLRNISVMRLSRYILQGREQAMAALKIHAMESVPGIYTLALPLGEGSYLAWRYINSRSICRLGYVESLRTGCIGRQRRSEKEREIQGIAEMRAFVSTRASYIS